mmetsp:Transcript_87707/g.252937  ORF Transcript_87707/g.252937 Transcript_87707/m.252937 type:complete len:247 (-) Transcript_87707:1028-1768(-)
MKPRLLYSTPSRPSACALATFLRKSVSNIAQLVSSLTSISGNAALSSSHASLSCSLLASPKSEPSPKRRPFPKTPPFPLQPPFPKPLPLALAVRAFCVACLYFSSFSLACCSASKACRSTSTSGTKRSRTSRPRYVSSAGAWTRPRKTASNKGNAKTTSTATRVNVPSSNITCLSVMCSATQSTNAHGSESIAVSAPNAHTSATSALRNASMSKRARKRSTPGPIFSGPQRGKRRLACSSSFACRI